MPNLYFPICGLFCIVLVVILFFTKQNVDSIETKIYGRMIVTSLLDMVLGITTLLIAYLSYNDFSRILIIAINKIDLMYYIFWPTNLFLYVYYVSYQNKEKFYKLQKILFLVDIIFIFLEIVAPIELIYNEGAMGIAGFCTNIVYFVAVLYLLAIIILLFCNLKKIFSKKYVPIFLLAILMGVATIIRAIDPTLIIIPTIFVYIDLIMYHTIENPDVKLIAELEVARDTAEKASHAKSDFLSSMSHEIRTPLNAIVGLSEDMKEYASRVPKEVLEDIEDIGNASQTLLEIVGNILDINKIESGKMELVSVPYNLVEEIKSLVSVTTTRIGTKPITFKLELDSHLPYILLGDKVHIKEIINNFLSNAIKYTESGSIVLSVTSENRESDCTLFIRVTDTGKGIREEDMPHLFGKFERLDVVKNSTIEGAGLGLAITKSLVEMMGGTIHVESIFGRGSVFSAEIPQKIEVLQAFVKEIEVLEVPEEAGYGERKILLVDDNKLNIKVARKALDSFGFEITECTNGVEALEHVVSGNEYDLILMDIMMPVMGGEEAMQKLKEKPGFSIPVLALTADAVDGAKEHYLSLGFTDYLAKPFTKKELQEKLDVIWKK